MGARKNTNDEAIFFENLNTWMLREANATWDNPYNFQFRNDYFNQKIVDVLRKQLSGYRRVHYIGKGKVLKYGSLNELDFPWGWKDPRNTFTLDLWSRIFPDAKVIHIHRNPVDVAASLRTREIAYEKNFQLNSKRALKEKVIKGRVSYVISLRVKEILEGIKLWEEYLTGVEDSKSQVECDWLDISYEDFLESPLEKSIQLTKFCSLDVDEIQLETFCSQINPDRKFSFFSSQELVSVYNGVKDHDLIKRWGYGNLL